MLAVALALALAGAVEGTVVCDGCPSGAVHVLAYPAADRYNWPWWNVYGFLPAFHPEAGALDALRPEPLASVRLDGPGRFRLELPAHVDAHLFALLDRGGDGPGRDPSGDDRVGRFPRNPYVPGVSPGEAEIILYPLAWRRDFDDVRWRPTPTDAPNLRFVDATDASGIDFRHCQGGDIGHLPVVVGSGALLDDLDGDGDLDLFTVQGMGACAGAPPNSRIHANDGTGHFRDVTDGSGLDLRATGMGVIGGDVDADGDLDLYVTTLQGGRLLRNDGGLRFSDVTGRAGVGLDGTWTVGATFGDVDGDGVLDLYVANYVEFSGAPPFTPDAEIPVFVSAMLSSPFAFPALANALFLGRGDGTFRRVPDALGAADPGGKGMATVLADLDLDGDLDLFVTNDCTKDRLFENRAGRFVDVSVAAGVDDIASGMGIALGDIDGDGRPDLLSPHWRNEPSVAYLNRSAVGADSSRLRLAFRDRTARSGVATAGNGTTGWAAELFDAEHDGDLDLLVTNGHTHPGDDPGALEPQPLQLYLNDGTGQFTDASCLLDEALPGPEVWRGTALGDIDGDGDTDVYLVAWNGRGRLLVNESRAAGSWIKVLLIPATGEVGAIGARVHAPGYGPARQVASGTGYLSHSSLEVELAGRGRGASPALVMVRWPDGMEEGFVVEENRGHTLVQGTGSKPFP